MNNDYIKVKIEGKNVNNYLKWLIKKHIYIINVNIIRHNLMEIIIEYKNYKKLFTFSKTYKIEIIEKYGKLKITDKLIKNIPIILSIITSIVVLYILSNIIFSVEIIYNDKDIVDKINKELEKYNIKKYHKKKNYTYIDKVKKKILDDNKDILEWIEIEEYGTKYIIRLVERKKEDKQSTYKYQSIVASKNAVINSIKAYTGEKIKSINEYVKKGEVIISGILTTSNDEKKYLKADGIVYGEVWYKVNVEYPFYYKEEKLTGKSKDTIMINFLNKKIPIFSYNKYKQFKTSKKEILTNNLIPISVSKEKLYELSIKEQIYTKEEVIQKAINESKKKLLEKNTNILEIKEVHILEEQNLNSKMKLVLFVSAIENITDILEIKEEYNEILEITN